MSDLAALAGPALAPESTYAERIARRRERRLRKAQRRDERLTKAAIMVVIFVHGERVGGVVTANPDSVQLVLKPQVGAGNAQRHRPPGRFQGENPTQH